MFHSCILDENQAVKCVGRNTQGQLGNGGSTSSTSFVTVTNLPLTSTLSVANSHSCALLQATSEVKCWGYGINGRLGTGGTAQANGPILAAQLNSGSANIQLVATADNTYVVAIS
jgi:alpha-tubulin suppressor-like RCC1 family protein